MANGKIRFGKQSGGQLALVIPDGVTSTDLVLPESGTVASVSGAVTDNAIVRFDGTTGKVQNSNIAIDDSGNIGSGTQSFNGFGGGGFKNYIINGNFDIWQYGTSQTITGYSSDDRWFNGSAGSTKTHSQVACTDVEIALFNASNFSRTVVTSVVEANNNVTKRQAIENVTKLAGKTVTLSFWAKADTTKNIWVEFKQMFGTGGSPSTPVVGLCGQAIPLTSTWQKKTITVTLPSIIGKTLGTDGVHTTATELQFWFDVGSNVIARIPTGIQQSGTFDIAQVQLEEGTVSTPFENRPYSLELSLCKRYARDIGNSSLYGHIGNGFAYSNTSALIEIDVEGMRTTPVIANVLTANLFELEGPVRYTASAISINGYATANTNKINLNITSSGLTTGYALGFRNNNTTTNKIILRAEL